MQMPKLDSETLSRMRMQECQGTIIGGMQVAASLGCSAREFGRLMMEKQNIRWEGLFGNLDKIAGVFYEHYQTTYGFGDRLEIARPPERLIFTMPSISRCAEYQLRHWRASAEQLQDLQRGYWQALVDHCGITVNLDFGQDLDRVVVTVANGNPASD